MPTTRPGYIWSGTEWVAIGQEAVINPFYYQATAPTSPATGAIWVESDVDVPSVDSAQFLRWRKTMTGGETSLSGNDDSSLPLAYTPGYEQLYINGVLQVRGQDYTATTGTTVTGLTALVANDVVEIFSAVARTVADVYTQTQSDARFVNKNVGGLVLVGSGTATAQNRLNISNCFSSTYSSYRVVVTNITHSTANNIILRFSISGTDTAGAQYHTNRNELVGGTTYAVTIAGSSFISPTYINSSAGSYGAFSFDVINPNVAVPTSVHGGGMRLDSGSNIYSVFFAGLHEGNTSFDGISLVGNTGNITCTMAVYGYNKGA